MSQWQVRQVTWQEARDELIQVRNEVFIKEQQVPEDLEIDAYDAVAIHALVHSGNGEAIATGRLLHSGKIGRMAVRKPWRGQGIGSAMLQTLTHLSLEQFGKRPCLEAQVSAIGFYEKYGFRPEGKIYMEAGIPHRLMRFDPEA